MPKLERLDWLAPLSDGRGVTLTDDPEADMFLAADPNALLLGVLYDSQFQTRRAFAIPLLLRQRLGHFDMTRMADEPDMLAEAFTSKPALHRFPNRFAKLTNQVAIVIVRDYGGDSGRIWTEADTVDSLAARLLAIPAFGPAKSDWTIGMLGKMGVISLPGWDGYRVPVKPKKAAAS
jgi:uncharacterized HhH-GPD family protein